MDECAAYGPTEAATGSRAWLRRLHGPAPENPLSPSVNGGVGRRSPFLVDSGVPGIWLDVFTDPLRAVGKRNSGQLRDVSGLTRPCCVSFRDSRSAGASPWPVNSSRQSEPRSRDHFLQRLGSDPSQSRPTGRCGPSSTRPWRGHRPRGRASPAPKTGINGSLHAFIESVRISRTAEPAFPPKCTSTPEVFI
jgi:hypothetical protein